MATSISVAAARRGRRDLLLVALAAGAAGLFVLATLAGSGPLMARLPGPADIVWRADSLRLLRVLTSSLAAILGVLAVLVVRRGDWLRRQGGLALLEHRARGVLAVLVLLHVGSTLLYFPLRQVASHDPVVSCDDAYHYAQVVTADRFLTESHRLWGYSPFFMAGYPAGVLFDLDMKGAEVFCHALGRFGLEYALKIYILLSLLLFPAAMYAAARLFRLGPSASILALLLALLYWHWSRPLLGQFKWAGMHSFVFAAYLAVLALALFYRFMDSEVPERARCYIWLVPIVAIAWQVHPLTALILAPGFLALYAGGWHRLRGRDHLALWLGFGLVLESNLGWILPFLHFRHYKTASDYFFQLHGWRDVVLIYSRRGSVLFTAITVLGLVGIGLLARRSRLAALAAGASAAGLFAAAFFGHRLPALANTEPGRYLVPFAFLMTLPAGLALVPLLRGMQRRIGPPLVTLALVAATGAMPLLSLADNRFFDTHQLRAEIDPRFRALLAFLQERTTPAGRILFETPGGYRNPSDLLYGGHLQALVPAYTHREVIGGPYPVNFMAHAAVDFRNGELLGRPLGDWSPAEFARFLDTYNIGWVVCWSGAARDYFEARADLLGRIGEIDRFRIYALPKPAGFLLAGTGRVTADYNRIAVTDAAGEELILKYHWLESLRSSPSLPLERYPIPGDPIGFIRVRPRGTTRFVIHNEY